jgi:hypothetical protein
MHLGGALQLAPALLKTTTGHVTGTISHGSSAGIGSRAGSRVLATQARIAAVVAVYGVTGTTTTDVVDGGSPAHITFEFFVEAEDGTLAAAVDVASTATARDKGVGTRESRRAREAGPVALRESVVLVSFRLTTFPDPPRPV